MKFREWNKVSTAFFSMKMKLEREGKQRRCTECGSLDHWEERCDFLSKGCIKLSKRVAELEEQVRTLQRVNFILRTNAE